MPSAILGRVLLNIAVFVIKIYQRKAKQLSWAPLKLWKE